MLQRKKIDRLFPYFSYYLKMGKNPGNNIWEIVRLSALSLNGQTASLAQCSAAGRLQKLYFGRGVGRVINV